MPIITTLPFDPSAISLSVERSAVRSSGIHLSTILKDMLITAGVVRRTKGKEFSSSEQHMIFEQGFLGERLIAEYIESPENQIAEWDRFVEKGLKPLVDDDIAKSRGGLVRPGEQLLDGIYMTPDAVNLKLWFYEEWKATAIRSQNLTAETLPSRKPEWLWQGAANCKAFDMTRTIFRVWHYSELPPTIKQYIVEWTKEERDAIWKTIVDHYEYMKSRASKQ